MSRRSFLKTTSPSLRVYSAESIHVHKTFNHWQKVGSVIKKKVFFVGLLVLVAIFFGLGSAYSQMMGPGMMGQWGYRGQHCP